MTKSYTSEYKIWTGMRGRCHNPNNYQFPYYGGRGITVCPRWRASFAAFLEDMGARPTQKHSIDRIDNSKGYSPDNCRWATKAEQSRNSRRAKLTWEAVKEIRRLRLEGFTQVQLAEMFSVSRWLIRQILNQQVWKEG